MRTRGGRLNSSFIPREFSLLYLDWLMSTDDKIHEHNLHTQGQLTNGYMELLYNFVGVNTIFVRKQKLGGAESIVQVFAFQKLQDGLQIAVVKQYKPQQQFIISRVIKPRLYYVS